MNATTNKLSYNASKAATQQNPHLACDTSPIARHIAGRAGGCPDMDNATGPATRAIPVGARVLRLHQVLERTGLSRATIYVLQANDPTWPRKIYLTKRTVGWLEVELDGWIASRAQLCVAA
ncbi:AlpA family phage regulatory protein [Caballeronia sp. LZ008]|uniref:helix-turn-helix transcriptional regulator n=1 Tax=unclassified Caballeronia TaxID=2646786 RepID=UPI002029362B|nr:MULTISPECIES: AlpA family phage regulatory protein [unclassified Caballeronia]MDR5794490.1 AlpA family phage regulatory protein [Caballeronia sp. LZ008]